jgi:hypothetical protein
MALRCSGVPPSRLGLRISPFEAGPIALPGRSARADRIVLDSLEFQPMES